MALSCFTVCTNAQVEQNYSSGEYSLELIDIIPESRVVINCPKSELINPKLPTKIVFYALPNGNTIEQTAGKLMGPADDWHFNIQHIAAQTRFLRENDPKYNYITVYLQASMKAWTAHSAKYSESPMLYVHLIDTVCRIISKHLTSRVRGTSGVRDVTGVRDTFEVRDTPGVRDTSASLVPLKLQQIVLSSHSGGGRFLFNYIQGVEKIPAKIKGIVFIDSNYGYEDSLHAKKMTDWIKSSPSNKLAVFSYVDTTVILNGKPIVSSKGGTGYRSKVMAESFMCSGINLRSYSDTLFRKYIGLGGSGPKGGRVQILIKENPTGEIFHTVLVERNGFIHSLLIGTQLEEKGYKFWGERAYSKFIE